jgi:acetyl esterase/lipase
MPSLMRPRRWAAILMGAALAPAILGAQGISPLASAAAPAPFRVDRDLAYLDHEPMGKLDLYLPSRSSPTATAPAVIWMHGNHHDKGDARERNVCETLARVGYVCASINYGTWTDSDASPEAPATDRRNLENAKAAVRFLRAHAEQYQIDPARIAASGGSAGGYLALMMGLTNDDPGFGARGPLPAVSSAVGAIIDFYGDYPPSFPGRVTSRFPPTFIAHGRDDPAVDYRLSVALDRVLAAKGVPEEFVLLDHVGHSFDLATWKGKPLPRDLGPPVLAFLVRYLGAAPSTVP